MPNWCDNYISIDANEELLEKIADFVRSEESDFDFEKVIPMPENIYCGHIGPKEWEIYEKNNWYTWRDENWGTEQKAIVQNAEPGEYWLQTAWGPCKPVIAKLARIFPEATITHAYEEEGCCFCGKNIYQIGELVYQMNGDYHRDWTAEEPDTWRADELEDWKIEDELYPLQEDGYICDTTEDGQLHIREYQNGRLFLKIDGEFEDHRPEGERVYRW